MRKYVYLCEYSLFNPPQLSDNWGGFFLAVNCQSVSSLFYTLTKNKSENYYFKFKIA